MSTAPSSPRRATTGRLVAVLACLLAMTGLVPVGAAPATAADLSRFDPGHLITDQNFRDSGAMSVAQVRAFIATKGERCQTGADGTPCLRDFRTSTPSRAADTRCTQPYTGRADETAADIVVGVAQACRISPRVLLVMLQKEQGLVTSTSPRASMYEKAMGFACPDTAACNPAFAGFFAQVYGAAWQLNHYALTPGYRHRARTVVDIYFHPNLACGSTPVFIRNQATASLYNYTPYQPNAAALAAGYGRGDACSAYGNRNFFNYFYDWFGNPTGVPPIGSVDVLTADNTSVTVQGWALDPDTSAPITVHVYVDGAPSAVLADLSRPDVAAVYGRGDRHGFRSTTAATPGPHSVCVYAINDDVSGNTALGCRTVVVPDRPPIGVVDRVSTTATSITVSGWTIDPDTTAPTDVHVYVDGVPTSVRADRSRPDVAQIYGRGDRHGFEQTVTVTPGVHQVCVYAINTVAGAHTALLCGPVLAQTTTAAPFGVLDTVTASSTGVSVSGWTIDPDTSDPTDVHVYVDGVAAAVRADGLRPDVGAAHGRGDRHGFTYSRPTAPGRHSVCVYAINTVQGPNTLLGCRDVVVRNSPPVGSVDSVVVGSGGLTVSGWTLDPDTSDPVEAHVYVDGVGVSVRADALRPDLVPVFGRGDRHGFAHTRALAPGPHTVCVFGIDQAGALNTLLGCRDVVVPGATGRATQDVPVTADVTADVPPSAGEQRGEELATGSPTATDPGTAGAPPATGDAGAPDHSAADDGTTTPGAVGG